MFAPFKRVFLIEISNQNYGLYKVQLPYYTIVLYKYWFPCNPRDATEVETTFSGRMLSGLPPFSSGNWRSAAAVHPGNSHVGVTSSVWRHLSSKIDPLF